MVLGALDKVTSFQTVSDKPDVITLCNQDGQPLMTLEKKAAPEVSLSDLSGEWVIELVNGKKIVGTAEAVSYTHLPIPVLKTINIWAIRPNGWRMQIISVARM